MGEHVPLILAIDTGGTMTDTVLVDEKGDFTIGKAQTTPEFEARGIINSLKDAARKWGLTVEEAARSLRIIVYSGTIMLNRVLERKGVQPLGLITTAGFEDTLRMGRSKQSWNTLSYAERLHAVSHFHPEPLIPRNMIYGVRERILVTGHEMIPLYEDEVEKAARILLERGAKAIIIAFLNSWANPSHELKAAEIVKRAAAEMGRDIPVYLSHRIAPILGELGRLNAVVIQAYAAEPSREQFRLLEKEFRGLGSRAPVYIFTNYGTVVPIEYERLVHTIKSGPAGGAVAVKHLADIYGIDYAVGIDVGGTSFDVTAILAGQPLIKPSTIVDRFETAIPSIQVESIGAGTGSYVRVDPITKAIRIGPDSAGYRVGVSWREGGVDTVTLNDVMVVLGYINPDYFLGGEIKLDKDYALKAFKEQVADKLGMDLYEAAWGVYQLACDHMKLHLESIVRGLGFSPEGFNLVVYGGGGPLMAASIVRGLRFAGVMIPELAPAFSAYGASLADLGIRAEMSLEVYVPPPPGMAPAGIALDMLKGVYEMLDPQLKELLKTTKRDIFEGVRELLYSNAAGALSKAWGRLEEYILEEFRRGGFSGEELEWRAAVRMLYAGMLDDVEVEAGSHRDVTPERVVEISRRFDELFEKIYAASAKSTAFGYLVTRAILTGYVKLPKPELRTHEKAGREPPAKAYKGERRIYWDGEWWNAKVYEMGLLLSGNTIEGPALIEAPATTLLVPPGYKVELDDKRVFWLTQKS